MNSEGLSTVAHHWAEGGATCDRPKFEEHLEPAAQFLVPPRDETFCSFSITYHKTRKKKPALSSFVSFRIFKEVFNLRNGVQCACVCTIHVTTWNANCVHITVITKRSNRFESQRSRWDGKLQVAFLLKLGCSDRWRPRSFSWYHK